MMLTDVVFGDGRSAREARVVMPCSSFSFCNCNAACGRGSTLDHPPPRSTNVLGELVSLACSSQCTTAILLYQTCSRLLKPRRLRTELKS